MNSDRQHFGSETEANARWSELLSFLREWNRPILSGDGLTFERLKSAEQRLRFQLPAALREWYLLSGRRSSREVSKTNFLVLPEELNVSEGVLVFYVENQSVVNWAIRSADLALDDPPVFIGGDWDDEHSTPKSEWIEENSSVSEFFFQMEVIDTIACSDIWARQDCDETTAHRVRSEFQPFGFPKWHWPVYPTELFKGSDVLIEIYDNTSFAMAARSQVALGQAMKLLE